ncbi:MAG: response regulator [Woeseia sp.]
MSSNAKKIEHILIVEDDPGAREATGLYLEYCGYDVATAPNAKVAYAKVERQVPTLLICDWQLGAGENGVAVARRLQEQFGIPVIFMTAYPLDELYAETDGIKVFRYLRKPVSLGDLADAIKAIH